MQKTKSRSSPFFYWDLMPSDKSEYLENIHRSRMGKGLFIWRANFSIDCYYPLAKKHKLALKIAKIENANHKRQAEFISGRLLASLATGEPNFLIRNSDGSPRWPEGFSGSITHNKNYVFLITSDASRRLGIDLEYFISDISYQAIMNRLITTDEKKWINSLPKKKRKPIVTLIFSAKEALFKSISPDISIKSNFLAFSVISKPKKNSLEIYINQDLSKTLPKGMSFKINYTWLTNKVLTWHNTHLSLLTL